MTTKQKLEKQKQDTIEKIKGLNYDNISGVFIYFDKDSRQDHGEGFMANLTIMKLAANDETIMSLLQHGINAIKNPEVVELPPTGNVN